MQTPAKKAAAPKPKKAAASKPKKAAAPKPKKTTATKKKVRASAAVLAVDCRPVSVFRTCPVLHTSKSATGARV